MADDGQRAKITLTAVDEFSAVFKQVSRGLGSVATQAAAVQSALGVVGATLGASLSVAGIATFVTSVSSGLNALVELREATGASVENISALEDVAARTGTKFETVTTALVKFNQSLINAKAGSDAARIFENLGLSVAELKQLDPAEALRQVAVGFSKFADDGNKARAVQELFGKSLREVAPLLNDLATSGKLVATVTTDQAEAAKRFSDNLDAISKNSKDVARSLTSDLIPALAQISEAFARGGIRAGFDALGNKLFDWENSQGRKQLGVLNKDIEDLEKRIKVMGQGPGAVFANQGATASLKRLFQSNDLATLQQELSALQDKRDAMTTRLIEAMSPGARSFTDPFKEALKEPNVELERYVAALKTATRAELDITAVQKARYAITSGALGKLTQEEENRVISLARQLDALKQKFDRLETPQVQFRRAELGGQGDVEKAFATDKLDKFIASQKELASLLGQTQVGQISALTKQYGLLNNAFNEGRVTAEQYIQALDILDEQFSKLTAPAAKAAEEMSEFAKQAQRNIQDALGDTLEQVLGGHFDNIGKMWLDLIRKMIAQAAAAKLNKALFGDDLSGGAIGPYLSEFFGAFGARASGGPVAGGGSYLVGERGPEMFIPRQSGTIVPNSAIGGPTINQYITVGSGVSRNDVALAMAAAKNAAVAEIADAQRRGRA